MFSQIELDRLSRRPPTTLCDIMNRNLSDKGNGHHNYTKIYDHLFNFFRHEKLQILEIGIGSVNPSVPSNMGGGELGKVYRPGASIRGWLEYFPNAEIYCCDIDRDILNFEDNRVHAFFFDQTNELIMKSVTEDGILKDKKFDIIIDDGLHIFPINCEVMKHLLPKLNPGGYYIIEDIIYHMYDHQKVPLDLIENRNYQYIEFPNEKNTVDNNLFIVKS
jgi:hypothetical protein